MGEGDEHGEGEGEGGREGGRKGGGGGGRKDDGDDEYDDVDDVDDDEPVCDTEVLDPGGVVISERSTAVGTVCVRAGDREDRIRDRVDDGRASQEDRIDTFVLGSEKEKWMRC